MWDKLRPIVSLVLAVSLAFWLVACGGKGSKSGRINTLSISEVSPPPEIQRLNRTLDRYMPQVTIVTPQSDQVLDSTDVTVTVAVKDLPIFKSELGLGNHIDVILDERQTQEIYDPAIPAQFTNVTPGTHTLRVFASRPWDESFKNVGAYAQTTFHVLTRTGEHVPRSDTPVLTYHSPIGTVGSDTVLLDFYLHNAPVPPSLLDSKEPSPWQIRATVNGDSFTIEDWHPLYLQGLKPGKNWIKLEFLDAVGNPLPNLTNSIAQIVTYDPKQTDLQSRLLKGETIPEIDQIVDPSYRTPIVEPVSTPVKEEPAPVEEITPVPVKPIEAVPAETVPVKKPRFQLFQKKVKVDAPAVVKEAPSIDNLPVEEQKEEKVDNLPVTTEEPKEQKLDSPPVEEQPIEATDNSSVGDNPTPTEDKLPIVEQQTEPKAEKVSNSTAPKEEQPIEKEETPKVGRFQSLKARYQKQEQTYPTEVPEQLSE